MQPEAEKVYVFACSQSEESRLSIESASPPMIPRFFIFYAMNARDGVWALPAVTELQLKSRCGVCGHTNMCKEEVPGHQPTLRELLRVCISVISGAGEMLLHQICFAPLRFPKKNCRRAQHDCKGAHVTSSTSAVSPLCCVTSHTSSVRVVRVMLTCGCNMTAIFQCPQHNEHFAVNIRFVVCAAGSRLLLHASFSRRRRPCRKPC